MVSALLDGLEYTNRDVNFGTFSESRVIEKCVQLAFGAKAINNSQPKNKSEIRVLLVEDNLVNQAIALKLLTNNGFEVQCAENGKLAVELYQENDFAAVLMDIQMPVMDGFEAAIRIREYEKAQHKQRVPIVAITAHDDSCYRQKAFAVGMDAFLSKPVRASELAQMLRKIISQINSNEHLGAQGPMQGAVELSSAPTALQLANIGLSEALRRLDGDVLLLQDLAEAFIEDYVTWHERFEEAVEVGDLGSVTHGARELQSSMRNFTVTEALATTMRLEQLSKQGEIDGVKAACNELDRQISPFLSVLKSLVMRRRDVMRG